LNFVVEEKKGTMVTASNGSQIVPGSSSQVKVIPKNLAQSQENRGKKDEEKTLRNAAKPSRNKGRHSAETIQEADQTSCETFRLCTSHPTYKTAKALVYKF